MKRLVVTFKLDNPIFNLIVPRIEKYAIKIKSDFLQIETEDILSHTFFKFEKYLQKYDRILFISPFVLIRPDTPDLFEEVPLDKIGVFNEGKYASRDFHMKSAMSFYNEKLARDWEGVYYNFDVMVFSRQHRFLFKKTNFEIGSEIAPYLNLKIHNTNTKVLDLHFKFNRMEFLDAQIGVSRLDSYMINYTDAPVEIVKDIIEKDIKQWENDSPNYEYKRNILIRLSGGIGDQIASEPVSRFVRKTYPDSNIYLVTHHPRLFKNLENFGIKIYDYTTWNGINDALIIMENNPKKIDGIKPFNNIGFGLSHPVDFSSISMLKRTLPFEDRQIQIPVDPVEIDSIMNLLSERNEDKPIIVVHPGKWWPSKTFPKDWWQKVVDLLSEKLTVVLIGKTLSENQGYVDIDCPIDGFDFRDFTTIGETVALISLAKVTLSNDSSPVHIAGGFDNWIVLIPTCKHPDHILPFRKGSLFYKTKSLYKKLLLDDLEVRHTEFHIETINKIPKGKTMYDYLPEVEDVVNEILNIY